MFTAMEHTWESVKQHLSNLLSHIENRLTEVKDDLQADLISMRADLRSVVSRIETLEQEARSKVAERISPTTYAHLSPERPQRTEPQPMILLSEKDRIQGERPAALEEIKVPVPAGDSNEEVSVLS